MTQQTCLELLHREQSTLDFFRLLVQMILRLETGQHNWDYIIYIDIDRRSRSISVLIVFIIVLCYHRSLSLPKSSLGLFHRLSTRHAQRAHSIIRACWRFNPSCAHRGDNFSWLSGQLQTTSHSARAAGALQFSFFHKCSTLHERETVSLWRFTHALRYLQMASRRALFPQCTLSTAPTTSSSTYIREQATLITRADSLASQPADLAITTCTAIHPVPQYIMKSSERFKSHSKG